MRKNIVVVDDFLDDTSFESSYDLLMNDMFPWYYNDHVVFPGESHFQFTHVFFRKNKVNSETYYDNLIYPFFIKKLDPFAIYSIKANLKLQTEKLIEYPLHTDYSYETSRIEDVVTAIYYVNTNNGYTIFEDGTKVKSVRNRMILFDGKIKHAGTSCTDEKTRCVINFNLIGKISEES